MFFLWYKHLIHVLLLGFGVICFTSGALASKTFFSTDDLTLSGTGYGRVFYGNTQSFHSGLALKMQGAVKLSYRLSSDLTAKGYSSVRLIQNSIFPDQNKAVFYENYLSLDSKTIGTIDIGQLKNVGYLLHAGPVDVGMLDADDSDLSFFYDDPSGFYAPCMTYMGTDSRDEKINYTTPNINGWTAGLTVVQSEDKKDDSIAPNVKVDHGKGVVSALRYDHTGDLFSWATYVSGAWYHNDRFKYKSGKTIDANHTEYATGFQLGYGDFSVGSAGRIIRFQKKTDLNTSYAWIVGIAYDPSPFGISLNVLNASADFEQENRFHNIMLSAKYNINSYLKATVSTGRLTFRQTHKKRQFYGVMGLEAKF